MKKKKKKKKEEEEEEAEEEKEKKTEETTQVQASKGLAVILVRVQHTTITTIKRQVNTSAPV